MKTSVRPSHRQPYRHADYVRRRDTWRAEKARDVSWGKLDNPRDIRYEPIDEVLASTGVRLLRALRFWDWIDMEHLRVVAGLSEDELERNAASVALGRYVKAGIVEVRNLRGGGWTGHRYASRDYRITPDGREWLRKRLETDKLVCAESEAA